MDFESPDIDFPIHFPLETGAALVGGQGVVLRIDGKVRVARADGGAAGKEGDGLGWAAVVGQRADHGLATPTRLPLLPLISPPEPPVPIRLDALNEETLPAMSSAVVPAPLPEVFVATIVLYKTAVPPLSMPPPPAAELPATVEFVMVVEPSLVFSMPPPVLAVLPARVELVTVTVPVEM